MTDRALKEFFYVDVDRSRSLLAQMQGGLIDSLTSETSSSLEGSAGASLFGIGGSGGYSKASTHQESRSFQEMVFVAFEALADERGLVTNLGDDYKNPASWETGDVHSRLLEGQLVRMTCDVQILDAKLFVERLGRFDRMAEGILGVGPQVSPKNSTPAQRRQLATAMKSAMMGGLEPEQLQAMGGFVDAFVGDDIAFRALACGRDHLELGFGGALLGRREYIQEERDSLFSRYGTFASSWTCLMQIAAIPQSKVDTNADSIAHDAADAADAAEAAVQAVEAVEAVEGADIDEDAEDSDGDGISRATMENLALELLQMMEKVGLTAGPRWPTVSVTPLAVYREVPTAQSES